jgi:hypothetical protein
MKRNKGNTLATGNLALAKKHEFVKHDTSVEISDLKPLTELVGSINENLSAVQNRKRTILLDLLYLHQNWDEYTRQKDMEMYQGDSGLYKFLHDNVPQNSSTSHADVKIVRLLAVMRKGHLLSQENNRIGSLKRIAYISNRRNPDDADKLRKELLDELPSMTNQEVRDRIDQYNREKGEPVVVRRKSNRPYELVVSADRGKVLIKEMDPSTAKKVGKLLEYMTPQRIDELLEFHLAQEETPLLAQRQG